MATALERVMAPAPVETSTAEHRRRPLAVLYGPLAVGLTVWGAVLARNAGNAGAEWLRVGLAVAWAGAGAGALGRPPGERNRPPGPRSPGIGAPTRLAPPPPPAHAPRA